MKNNNQKITYKLALQSLKASKMRNIFILITIALSVSLISGLVFFVSVLKEINRKELATSQHVIYHEVTDEQISGLKQDERVSNSVCYKRGKSFEVDHYILLPYYLEESKSPMMNINIAEGTYPKAIDEVVVDAQLLDLMGVEAKVGQKIDIQFLDGSREVFEVSGLIRSEQETTVFHLFVSPQYAKNGSQLKDIPFDLAAQISDEEQMNSNTFLEKIHRLGADYGVERRKINENNKFVDSLSYDLREMATILLIELVILLVSILVIYSIFYLAISERTRQFGQLRTLGMTRKQIKRMVYMEGGILSLIGSTIGIIIGALFAFIMKPQGFRLSTVVCYSPVILIVDYITVYLSILKPAKIAANTSPIEASKWSGYENKIANKEAKKLYRKLSPVTLSIIAARGNRKKSTMTMISLGLAGIVFMSASSFLVSIDEEKFSRQGGFQYGEYILTLSSNAAQVNEFGYMGIKRNNPLSDELIEEIKKIDGVTDVIPLENLNLTYTYKDVIEARDVMMPFSEEEAVLMQPYIKNGTLDYNKMIENKEILISNNDMAKELLGWPFEVGDRVRLKWYNGEKYVEDDFTIAGEMKSNINSNHDLFKIVFNTGWFLIPQELIKEMMIPGFNLNNRIIISSDDYKDKGEVIEEALAIIEANSPLVSLETLRASMEYLKKNYNMTYATAMGAALFIIAFSVISLLNTLISNIMARKREFACLRTLGMSEKQLVMMIQGEGLYFALVNSVVTIIVGGVCGYALVELAVYNGLNYLIYQFPLGYLVGYSLVSVIVPIGIARIVVKIFAKKSLVDRLRENE